MFHVSAVCKIPTLEIPAATLIFQPFLVCYINTVGDGGSESILGTVSAWIAHRECRNEISPPSEAPWHSSNRESVCLCESAEKAERAGHYFVVKRGQRQREQERHKWETCSSAA